MTEHLTGGAATEVTIRWRSSLSSGDATTRVRSSPRVLAGDSMVHLVTAAHLGAITSDADHSGSNRVRLALEVVPADVRKHRDCH